MFHGLINTEWQLSLTQNLKNQINDKFHVDNHSLPVPASSACGSASHPPLPTIPEASFEIYNSN